MTVSEAEKKRVRITLLVIGFGLYLLEGILINPLIVWTALPLLIGYWTINAAWKKGSVRKLRQGYGFLVLSIAFSYLYHFAWFFDWEGTKTGGSTSALIFVWFPIYAVLFGFIGYFVGALAKDDNASDNRHNTSLNSDGPDGPPS